MSLRPTTPLKMIQSSTTPQDSSPSVFCCDSLQPRRNSRTNFESHFSSFISFAKNSASREIGKTLSQGWTNSKKTKLLDSNAWIIGVEKRFTHTPNPVSKRYFLSTEAPECSRNDFQEIRLPNEACFDEGVNTAISDLGFKKVEERKTFRCLRCDYEFQISL